MLRIKFCEDENTMLYPQLYFNDVFEPEWFEDPLVKEMIKDIDKSEVLGPYCIKSPVLGQIPTTQLSSGVKALILMLKDESGLDVYATVCGDNCAKWILEISKIRDITISLVHDMDFPTDDKIWSEVEVYDVLANRRLYNYDDYLDAVIDYYATLGDGEKDEDKAN